MARRCTSSANRPDTMLLSTEAHPTRGEFVAIDLGDLLLLSPDEQVGRWREHRPEIAIDDVDNRGDMPGSGAEPRRSRLGRNPSLQARQARKGPRKRPGSDSLISKAPPETGISRYFS
jgi:hypothetical protein